MSPVCETAQPEREEPMFCQTQAFIEVADGIRCWPGGNCRWYGRR